MKITDYDLVNLSKEELTELRDKIDQLLSKSNIANELKSKIKEERRIQPKKKQLSQKETFLTIMDNLQKQFEKVPFDAIIAEMVKSGKFTTIRAREYFKNMERSCYVFEAAPRFYKLV